MPLLVYIVQHVDSRTLAANSLKSDFAADWSESRRYHSEMTLLLACPNCIDQASSVHTRAPQQRLCWPGRTLLPLLCQAND